MTDRSENMQHKDPLQNRDDEGMQSTKKKLFKIEELEKNNEKADDETKLRNRDKTLFTDKLPLRFDEWETTALIDHVIDAHHVYIRKTIPVISGLLEEVVNQHEKHHHELLSISRLFHDMSKELLSHMIREEQILFPFIKKYYSSKNPKQDFQKTEINNIHSIIREMEREHDVFGRKMDMIRVISGNYNLPDDDDESYVQLFTLLKEFENDFFIHLHLEAHILFPKVAALE